MKGLKLGIGDTIEVFKALLKSHRPATYFYVLRDMEHLQEWFPEVYGLINVPQNHKYHPEGDVFTHTMLVLNQAAWLKDTAEYPFFFMVAALCPDFGKAVTTEIDTEGNIHSVGHEKAGVPLVREFIPRVFNEKRLYTYVANMTEHHMKPSRYLNGHSKASKFNHMFYDSVCPHDLMLLFVADNNGRDATEDIAPLYHELQMRYKTFLGVKEQPYVTGDDLRELGYKPSERFGQILEFAHRQRMNGESKERTLQMIKGQFPLKRPCIGGDTLEAERNSNPAESCTLNTIPERNASEGGITLSYSI